MRRLAIVSLPLAVLSGIPAAQAQSSVTLYGEIDNAFAYYNNVGHHSLVGLQGADFTANQWGLKGKEDRGGGFQAIFNLENGFDINTGTLRQGGREFGKNAWVGLASNSLGSVTIGRQLDPTVDLVQPLTADGYGPAFSTPGDADNNDNTFRVDNSIKYTSPMYGGLQYELMYGLGGVPGSVSFIGSRSIFHVAAQYVIGPFTANIRYSNAQWKPYVKLAAFNRTETFNTGATSLQYQISPAMVVNAAYTYMRSSGASSATYHTVAVGTEYFLSKRTTLYAISAYSHARGTTFSSDGNALVAAGGTVGDLESSSGTPNQVAVILRITHQF